MDKAMIVTAILSLALMLYIHSRFRATVRERLKAGLTHKEYRRLETELREEYKDLRKNHTLRYLSGTSPCSPELKRLSDKQIPPELVRIRKQILPAGIMQILLSLLAVFTDSEFIIFISAAVFGSLISMFCSFIIKDRVSLPEEKTKSPKKKEKNKSRWIYNIRQKRRYTEQEKPIVRTAFILRYGFAVPALVILSSFRGEPAALIIGSLLCIADGALIQWHFKRRTHAFYCMMQDTMHEPLTPFVHSPGTEKRAEKEGKHLGLILIIIGILTLAIGIICAI